MHTSLPPAHLPRPRRSRPAFSVFGVFGVFGSALGFMFGAPLRFASTLALGLSLALVSVVTGAACGGGQYSTSTQRFGGSERGEVNGRMFDYVSMSAEGDQWEIRIRGTSMWLAYSLDDKTESFKSVSLSSAESDKVWKLVDVIDLPSRRRGRIDEANGTVLLRLREPGEEEHDIYSVYFSREAENAKVQNLAKYLSSLAKKYYKEKPLL